jgi:hypothetical protein
LPIAGEYVAALLSKQRSYLAIAIEYVAAPLKVGVLVAVPLDDGRFLK